MLLVTSEPMLTERLTLRRLQPTDAETLWPVLADTRIYTFIPRDPPARLSDLETRFARIAAETAPDRKSQWLNWVVSTSTNDAAIGIVEATISPDHEVEIAYMFASSIWGKGYAREAVAAALAHLTNAGARAFNATLDTRNDASRRIVAALGFSLMEVREKVEFFKDAWSDEETWRLETAHAAAQS